MKSFMVAVALTFVGLLPSCGGSGGNGGSKSPPIGDVSGSWNVTEKTTSTNCPGDVAGATTQQSYYLTQSTNTLTLSSNGNYYNGLISGGTMTGSASYPEDGGTTSVNLKATLDTSCDSFTGVSTWSWRGQGISCNGTTSLTANRSPALGCGLIEEVVIEDPPEDPQEDPITEEPPVITNDVEAPTTPTNFLASTASSSKINLSWSASSDNVGVTGYTVYKNSVFFKSVTTAFTFDANLTANTNYCYSVLAKDAAGNESIKTSQVCSETLSPPLIAPFAPNNITASDITDSSVVIKWEAGLTNVSGYEISDSCRLEATVSTGERVCMPDYFVATASNITSPHMIVGLRPNTNYDFYVRAINSAGASYARLISFVTSSPAATVPDAPSNLSAIASSDTEISLTWIDNSNNEDGFEVQFKLSSDSDFTILGKSDNPNAIAFNVTDTEASTTYYFRIRANNSTGDSEFSNTVQVTTADVAVSTPVLRIINDLSTIKVPGAYVGAPEFDWGKYNQIIRVRIGPTQNSVVNDASNQYEVLAAFEYVYSFAGYTPSIKPVYLSDSSYKDFDVSDQSLNYSVYIQAGYWDAVYDVNNFNFLRWQKQVTKVSNCFGYLTYKYEVINVTDHSEGILEIKVSDFLPHGNWQSSPFCN